jgi:hypothetical protein
VENNNTTSSNKEKGTYISEGTAISGDRNVIEKEP